MKMTMLSSGRNSPCLITQGALKLWAEPVSHKNTQDDRDYHDQQLDREQIHIITFTNMDFRRTFEMNMDLGGKLWAA